MPDSLRRGLHEFKLNKRSQLRTIPSVTKKPSLQCLPREEAAWGRLVAVALEQHLSLWGNVSLCSGTSLFPDPKVIFGAIHVQGWFQPFTMAGLTLANSCSGKLNCCSILLIKTGHPWFVALDNRQRTVLQGCPGLCGLETKPACH